MKKIAVIFLFFLNVDAKFQILPLSDELKQQLVETGSWNPKCPVPLDRLKVVCVDYFDFKSKIHEDGKLIVLDCLAKKTLDLFKDLFSRKFPFESIKPISDFGGDDIKSMNANNTHCFHYRMGNDVKKVPSLHAYGAAIDINPLHNPCLIMKAQKKETEGFLGAQIFPLGGASYVNRIPYVHGMVEVVTGVFKQHGFTVWGGKWRNSEVTWHHISISRALVELLVALSPAQGEKLFLACVVYPSLQTIFDDKVDSLTMPADLVC